MSRVACCLGIYDNGERERGVMEPVQDGGRAAGWTIAAITIGQTPRNDIVPELKTLMRLSSGLEHPVSLLEFGALDGLSGV